MNMSMEPLGNEVQVRESPSKSHTSRRVFHTIYRITKVRITGTAYYF